MMNSTPASAHSPLADALRDLAEVIADADFALAGDRRESLLALRDRLIDDVRNHATRARDVDAPLLVVLGGVTGAGKSTVTNTIAGRPLVATGVIRPTTMQPTLLCHPADLAWFTGPRMLASLSRQVVTPEEMSAAPTATGSLRVVPLDDLEPGLALLDAPDIDSVSTANRDLADLLLDAADVWLWFTTVGKYADIESMRYLARAERRGTALVVVLTQVRDSDRDAVIDDFALKLAGIEVQPAALVVIPRVDEEWLRRDDGAVPESTPPQRRSFWRRREPAAEPGQAARDGAETVVAEAAQPVTPQSDSMLPQTAMTELQDWLDRLADPGERQLRRSQTLRGAVSALSGEVMPIIDGTASELDTAKEMLSTIDRTYDEAVDSFARSIDDGLPLRGEILGRWTDYVGSSRMLELTGRATSQAKRWITDLLQGSGSAGERRLEREVRVEVADTVTDTMIRLADLAATDTLDEWGLLGGGRALAEGDLRGHEVDLPARCLDAVRAWQDTVVDLVADKGVERKTKARWMSTAINALATGAIVVALASTGGLTGAEAGIATAAGAANQALLVTVLGERTVRWLVSESRKDLVRRFSELLIPERRRLAGAVAAASPDPELPSRMQAALDRAVA